jgi:hypothetical protein
LSYSLELGPGERWFVARVLPPTNGQRSAHHGARAKMSVVQRRRPLSVEPRAKLAAANRGKPQSPELVAKRFASGRAARIANEQQMAARCYSRAAQWADAIREGVDPDIARFARDQAVAWQLLSASYARSARDALIGPEDA